MEKRTSAIARIVAVLALAAAVAAVFLIVSSGVDEEPGKNSGKQHPAKQREKEKPPPTTAKTYEVKPGDTMTRIAYKTGITVQELKALNPESDPLALIAGEILKLR